MLPCAGSFFCVSDDVTEREFVVRSTYNRAADDFRQRSRGHTAGVRCTRYSRCTDKS